MGWDLLDHWDGITLVANSEFGKLVVLKNGQMDSVPLEDVAGKMRLVTIDHEMIKTALSLGLSLGNPADVPFEKFYTELANPQ